MVIRKVDNASIGLPPSWATRLVGGNKALGSQPEIRKLLGEPLPRLADLATLAPQIAAMFRKGGLLDRIGRKLATISGKKGGRILPAHNTIAAVDDDDTLFVGVEFLEACQGNEAAIAGILAHEWGHMVSDLPKGVDWSHLSWDELFALRREEEAGADAYAGRALYQMAYDVEPVVQFLQHLDARRKVRTQIKTVKYFPVTTRVAILREAFRAERRIEDSARKLLNRPGYRHPSFTKLLAVG